MPSQHPSNSSPAFDGTSALARSSAFEVVRQGREVIRHEGETLLDLSQALGNTFHQAVELIHTCEGTIVVSGMGKAGLVGQKISATLCSTGTRSIFLHPAEAIHGDLGRLHADDLVLMLSHSGETDEVLRLLPAVAEFSIPMIAITGSSDCTLGQAATVSLELGELEEADPNRLAPSTSTTAMMALGDALALVVCRLRGFQAPDFARLHPGGSLGLKLALVDDLMRPLDDCRVARESHLVRDVFVEASRPGRRSGAIMLHDEQGRLKGIFTDSDLAKLLEHRQDETLDEPIGKAMTLCPATVTLGTPLPEAVDILAARKISELPVVDQDGRPAGMLDITDVVALLPQQSISADETLGSGPKTIPFSN